MKNTNELNRRDFLIRTGKVGASILTASAIGYVFHDPKGPSLFPKTEKEYIFPDFSIPDLPPQMCIVKGNDRRQSIEKAFQGLGGIEKFISRNDTVVLKVNAAFASPPMLSATTHPETVKAVARLCFKAGASKVIITDNPINDPISCFKLTGIEDAAKSVGATLIPPEERLFKPVTVARGKLIRDWPVIYDPFENVDKLIGIAPVKDHHRSGASMSMKNWYGLLGGRRNVFHQDIHTIIMELALMVTPTLVVLDGITTMMQNGPTGGSLADLKQTDTLIVSTDQTAADAFGATLLDKTPQQLPHLQKAEDAGVGATDYRSLDPIMISDI